MSPCGMLTRYLTNRTLSEHAPNDRTPNTSSSAALPIELHDAEQWCQKLSEAVYWVLSLN